MNTFKLPTIISLTAPTCAGKSYLLEGLVNSLGFERIVSTTDRSPRAGEIEGVHFSFISTEQSKKLEAQGDLAELITYNGVRYGVTHHEMESRMQSSRPPILIAEPQGLEIYQKYCLAKGWQLFKIYVNTPEDIRIGRLAMRTTQDVVNDAYTLDKFSLTRIVKEHVERNNKRLKAIIEQERSWQQTNRWDLYVSGLDLNQALTDVTNAINSRNSRSELYA